MGHGNPRGNGVTDGVEISAGPGYGSCRGSGNFLTITIRSFRMKRIVGG